MANIIRKVIVLIFFLSAVYGISPSISLAARVAGDAVPVPPVVTPPSPDTSPAVKRPERKSAPLVFPQTLQKKEGASAAPAKAAKPATEPRPATAPSGAAPAEKVVEKLPVQLPGGPPPPPRPAVEKLPVPPPDGPPPPPLPAEQKKSAKETRYVTIDFDNVDIQVFVKFVSELTGKNFVIDDKVKGKVTIISPRKISIDEVYKVFESVLEVNGFATVTAGEVIKIVPALTAREKLLETKLGNEGGDREDKLITQIITLEHANPDDVKKVLDPLISRTSVLLSYPPTGMLVITDYQSNIQKVLEIIGALDVEGMAAQISYLPLQAAVATDIVKSLTVLFQPLPGRMVVSPVRIVADERANAIIIVASEIESERIKKLIAFMDKDVPKGAATLKVYRLQNAVAEDMAKVLMNIPKAAAAPAGPAVPGQAGKSPLISKDVQVVADKATNTLIITASNDDYKILEDVIKSLDISRPMVFIEALIMEVNANKDFRVGVEWQLLKNVGNNSLEGLGTNATGLAVGGFKGSSPIIPQGLPPSLAGGLSLGVVGAGIKIGDVAFPNIGAMINAFQSDTGVSILSNPQIMTLDNEEAEINVGQNVPYVTRQDTSSGITQVAGGINYSSFEYKDVGVILKITPHINEENYVRLKLDQSVSSVLAGSPTGLPTTLKRQAKTVVVVKDTDTIVIGGMLGDSTNDTITKVPWLGDIPLIGWLFKSYGKTREKTNLYVFITPHIIRTQKDAAVLYQDKREQMGVVEEGVIKLDRVKKDATGVPPVRP